MDCRSFPVQAAGRTRASGILCSVPASLRLEFVVSLAVLEGSPSVLSLFRDDPFHGKPPSMVRTVISQYWFTDIDTKRRTGEWWRRQDIGPFTVMVMRGQDGSAILGPAPDAGFAPAPDR